ncbi:MAG TPA: alpha/beta hydrolase [Xanthobacteraceae bacterium]|jgi:pimeloyl-ACP methyl ester carboxylesterase|nr:alpha/beta hydrolase [Xanthobacteraceae bacterium]
MVRHRHVYHIAGYDPIDAGAQYRRFVRQLDVFRRTWNVDASVSELEQDSDQSRAWWSVRACAPNWQVEAVHEALLWDDIVRGDFTRPLPVRLFEALRAYLDFIVTGTMFRYIVANQRYAIFFLFPILSVVLFAAVGWFFARLLTGFVGLDGFNAVVLGVPAGLLLFLVLMRWPGRRWRVEQLLDDWVCAHDYIHGGRPDIDARLDRFAETLLARAREGGLDEIVLVGHSLGAMLVLDVIVRALARDAGFARRGAAVSVLTIGATIPKFALHPRAQAIRARIARVVAEPSVAWTEYQSRADTISFYKFDPVSLRRIDDDRLDGKPVIRRVQIHDMLLPETFERCRTHVLRLHYRSVMANDRRAPYDYFLMACGPVSFANWTTSPLGFLDFLAADGTYRDPAPSRVAAAQPSL